MGDRDYDPAVCRSRQRYNYHQLRGGLSGHGVGFGFSAAARPANSCYTEHGPVFNAGDESR